MFFSILALLEKPRVAQPRIHDFTRQTLEQDYCFGNADVESSTCPQFYMTGVGANIRQNDRIVLHQDAGATLYQVEQIDYYSNVPNLWMALLSRVEPLTD